MPLPKSILCSHCKKTYPEGWKRCPYCGHDEARQRADAHLRKFMQQKLRDWEQRFGKSRGGDDRKRGTAAGDQQPKQQRGGAEGQPGAGPRRPQRLRGRDGRGRQQQPQQQQRPGPDQQRQNQPRAQQQPSAAQTAAGPQAEGSRGGERRRRKRRGGNRDRAAAPAQQNPASNEPRAERPQGSQSSPQPRRERPDDQRKEAAPQGSGDQTPRTGGDESVRHSRRRRMRRRGRGGSGPKGDGGPTSTP